MSDRIHYQAEDGLARIVLDDGKANAMDRGFFEALESVLDQAEKDAVEAVVLSGRPGFFSAGLNVKVLPTLEPTALNDVIRRFARALLRVFTFPRPTVAACTGHAIAGGAGLACACDLRFFVEGDYRLQFNEVVIGLAVPSWMALIARSALPNTTHVQSLLHARAWTPREALARGVIHGVAADPDAVLDLALREVAPLRQLDAASYAETKHRLRADDVAAVMERLERELPAPESG